MAAINAAVTSIANPIGKKAYHHFASVTIPSKCSDNSVIETQNIIEPVTSDSVKLADSFLVNGII